MADGTKKRKRSTENSSQPNDKASLESSTKHVKISVQEVDKWAPIVASTPGVAIPTSISLQPYTKQRPNAPQRSGRNAITTTELLLHSSAHPSLDYTAREEEEGGTDALQKHYVGVYNPETGKLEVMEARKMVVRGIVRAQQASAEDETIMNYRESRTELGNLFGTKKARKTIASRTDNAIAPEKAARTAANGGKPAKLDPITVATLATMKQTTTGMATKEQLAAVADASKPRPKANLDATDVQDVYTLDSLIGNSMLELVPVREWEKAVKDKKEVMVPVRYVAERIRKLASQKSPEKLKALRYVLCLMEFYNSAKANRGGRVLPKRSELRTALGDMPEPVQEDIRRRFSTAGTISKFQGDLLITTLCALACLIDNFEVDIFGLAEALRLEVKEVSTYFHEIGAKVVACPEAHRKLLGLDKAAAAQRKFAKLKLPLDFPKVNFPRGKR